MSLDTAPIRRRRQQPRPLPPGAAGPSLAWPLAIAAVFRLVYGVDSLIHGSPTMLAAGGWAFSIWWGGAVVAVNSLALLGLARSIRTRWRHEGLEQIGNIAVVSTAFGITAAVIWNAAHTLPQQGLVFLWTVPALYALPAWRIANLARNTRARARWTGGPR